MNEIYQLPLFEGISQDEMRWLLDHSYEMFLDRGEFFVQVNEPADRFYVVLEGELQITRTINKQEMVLGTTPRGIIGGEVALLHGTPSDMSVRAIVPSHLLVFEQQAFFALFATCPMVGSRILRTATERMHQFAAMLQQQEKMAALGKLSAGLAHELNNPAAGRAPRRLHAARNAARFADANNEAHNHVSFGRFDAAIAGVSAADGDAAGHHSAATADGTKRP